MSEGEGERSHARVARVRVPADEPASAEAVDRGPDRDRYLEDLFDGFGAYADILNFASAGRSA